MSNDVEVGAERLVGLNAAPSLANEVAHTVTADASRRWNSEAGFFDRLGEAIEKTLGPVSDAELARYIDHPRRIYDKEFRFRILGDLTGKRVLDLGCGEGSNSVLLAKRGAQVDGVDISPKLIELGRRRAQINCVEKQIRLQCAPVEQVSFPDRSFDVIWGDGILHHLIDVLEPTLQQLVRWAKPGALFLFSEPVNLNPILRRLRLKVPIHTDATPDERPLNAAELDLLRRYLPRLEMRHFHGLSRFTRFVVPLQSYETAPWMRRTVADAIHLADHVLLSVATLRTFGGMSVMWGHLGD